MVDLTHEKHGKLPLWSFRFETRLAIETGKFKRSLIQKSDMFMRLSEELQDILMSVPKLNLRKIIWNSSYQEQNRRWFCRGGDTWQLWCFDVLACKQRDELLGSLIRFGSVPSGSPWFCNFEKYLPVGPI